MEHVAAPQQLAAKDTICKASSSVIPRSWAMFHYAESHTVPMLGTASSGSERSAPIVITPLRFQSPVESKCFSIRFEMLEGTEGGWHAKYTESDFIFYFYNCVWQQLAKMEVGWMW